jgi:hypothetical protein
MDEMSDLSGTRKYQNIRVKSALPQYVQDEIFRQLRAVATSEIARRVV